MQLTAAPVQRSGAGALAQRASGRSSRRQVAVAPQAAASVGFFDSPTATNGMDSMTIPGRNTWIEKPEAVKDFATLQSMLDEIQNNIALRQDTISLLTGEVSRLRGQMGGLEGSGLSMGSNGSAYAAAPSSLTLGAGSPADQASAMAANLLAARAESVTPAVQASAVLSMLTDNKGRTNIAAYGLAVASIVAFGGVVAPVIEDKLGLGGAAYYDFITSNGLPNTMAEVDPIVASHCGGAVGVLSAQLANEAAQARRQGRRQ
ncbi:hypothetical protein C2E20_4829 [Micractinium conductrix]|uniref:Uncharacterized protein n=1 Tax=Micractinium conductrix TaxID=554055 RepID=A0A2P6VC88_9CHLO|nr:hypothetical protein C2E20_4829 [Micractinium conductrix]|eukprot:PSC71699.1 hypothetical protein C2E20_4829 [Micractinium conductrix]